MPEKFMDVKETAKFLNMSVTWVYRDAPNQGLTPYKFGSSPNAKIQYKISEVQQWIKQQKLG
ncbi:hypothetical protein Sgleb_60320 [Streptomyces glebosus]|uniref:Helix-turn-helix domain-containing protein n=1 Tax=Streptomyces glebosus TaxID=249580 RepID=A0A640T8K4_9ACTN|nr:MULTISPECIES: helix-turn-helix domain-containing protein [Streptomyces]QZY15132.1 helix-turn-helix domain-containing protein [Streptomyces decoyicus]GFE17985.1 hypothetical protein Sgleb_60320 [Streptomyces glebosus]GHG46733.1 hypothetical protein GCM10010513_02680 [Streptomyces glebosus]